MLKAMAQFLLENSVYFEVPMKIIVAILILSACAFGQDICSSIVPDGVTPVVKNVAAGTSIRAIQDVIDTKGNGGNWIIKVPAGTYSGEEGVLINKPGICLFGVEQDGSRPLLKRTRFENEEYESPVVKIESTSNVVVSGFEIQGVIVDKNKDVTPTGIAVRNFSDKHMLNITVAGNIIHEIGQTYTNCTGKADDGKPKSCGHAYGILVNSSNGFKVRGLTIKENKIYNLRLGKSEALAVNNDIEYFTISNNEIWNVDNIAIDIGGMQNSKTFQPTKGSIVCNKVHHLVKPKDNEHRNKTYPFIAGIYIDGGTGVAWGNEKFGENGKGYPKSIDVAGNTVERFGVGIVVGSENKYCKDKGLSCHVSVKFVNVSDNLISENKVYGVGIGKNDLDQNSYTSDVIVSGNRIVNNIQSTDENHKNYSHLHFGSIEKDSLKNILVKDNFISGSTNSVILVRVADSKKSYLTPDVKFYNNAFFGNVLEESIIWRWGKKSDEINSYSKKDLVKEAPSLILPTGVTGEKNSWRDPFAGNFAHL